MSSLPSLDGQRLAISNQLVLTCEDGQLKAVGVSFQRLELSPKELFVLQFFSTPQTRSEVARRAALAAASGAFSFIKQDEGGWLESIEGLAAAGLLRSADAPDPCRGFWEPHELLFHIRIREEFAAWLKEPQELAKDLKCPPAVAEARQGVRVQLATPAKGEERTFLEVLARRRSLQPSAGAALSFDSFSALFYHAARNLEFAPEHPHDRASAGGTVRRPYPSGGSRHPLEFYPMIGAEGVEGIPAGVYHYHPEEHALELVSAGADTAAPSLQFAQTAALMKQTPPVVIVLAARMGRMNYKYARIGYGLVLKEVGCALQTFYLVGTYLGLGVRALGLGMPSTYLANAAGFDEFAQPIVSEMIVAKDTSMPSRISGP